MKKKVGFAFTAGLDPLQDSRIPVLERKKGKVSTAVRYLRATPYVFFEKGFYGDTLPTSYAVRVLKKSSYGGTLPTSYAVRVLKEVLA